MAEGRQWGGVLDEPVRRRLGQCRDAELLLLAEDKADRRTPYRTRYNAKADVFDYTERFNNLNLFNGDQSSA